MEKLIAANWKMNGRLDWSTRPRALAKAITRNLGGQSPRGVRVLLCPPAYLLPLIAKKAHAQGFNAGAQNCSDREDGAYTGEMSAAMCRDAEADYVILGHSERRSFFHETDEIVCQKAMQVHKKGLVAIICIGESLAQREAGQAEAVTHAQINASVPSTATGINTVIAYEPIWAIGTGLTPTLADITKIHGSIRQALVEKMGKLSAQSTPILYGGSVKPDNAADILALKDVDGALVGGASLDMETFAKIVAAAPQS